MTEQEQINQQLQSQIDSQNARLDKALANFDTKFNMMMAEIRQQREDMRRLWDRQDEERREMQKRQDEMQAKHDAEMHEMNERFYNKIDDNFKTLSNQIHSNFVQTMVGFGAIAAAVGGIIIAAFK